jgi:predicted O-linked N-acetylglucosamine transferase (SPINDLY family)
MAGMPTIREALTIAVQHHRAGRWQAAEEVYRQILAVHPDQVDALHLLGVIAYQAGRHEVGIEYIKRAIRLKGNEAAFHCNLGNALRDHGKLDEAVACYREAVNLQPRFAEAHNGLGMTLKKQRKLDEAIASWRRALELRPDYADALFNLALALKEQRKLDKAVACWRRALMLKPDDAAGHSNLGAVLNEQGNIDEAVASYRQALELKPDYAEAYNNLGVALQQQGNLDGAISSFRRALECKPDYPAAHSNFLLALQYDAGATLSGLAAAHAEYDSRYAGPLRPLRRQPQTLPDPLRRLRVAFLSPDFRRHPVGHFLIQALENFDREQWETICYCDRVVQDDLTTRLRAAATVWRDVVGSNDEELTEGIRADQVDVLFDLAGHTAGNRLLVFARKPAPIQITWLGYVGTTGLQAMDYLLADRFEIPLGQERFYRERILRMPDGYVCYEPPATPIEPGPLPALENGIIHFGSFNNPAKITPQVVEVWAKILNRVPGSRLVMKYRGWEGESVLCRSIELFQAAGVDAGRLEFAGRSDHAEFLAAYRQIDVALDPFPYGGGVTTCEALWMGVPVVTCPGETFASRHALSHLSNVGLTETIARDLDEYVELAASLAGDLARLAALRAGLRDRMAASPLCDGKRFAANLMRVVREVWQQWCRAVSR